MFQVDVDNRSNFPTERSFHIFKKQRFATSLHCSVYILFDLVITLISDNLVVSKKCTLCLKKVPTFKLSVTLSNLNRFLKFCTAEKPMKFATNLLRLYATLLKHVATLLWEIKNSNLLQIFSRYG